MIKYSVIKISESKLMNPNLKFTAIHKCIDPSFTIKPCKLNIFILKFKQLNTVILKFNLSKTT